MPIPRVVLIPIALGLAAPAAAPEATPDRSDNYRLLQAMPRERRIALSETLGRFDRLSSAEQASIRGLDARIGAMDPVDRARYRSALRRYHLWVNGLSAEHRQALATAQTPEARFALARQFRLKEKGPDFATGPRLAGIRVGHYGLIGPIEAANFLKIWNTLTPARKAEVGKRPGSRIRDEIKAQGKAVPWQRFPPDQEAIYDARLEKDEEFRALIGVAGGRIVPVEPRAEADRLRAEADRLAAEARKKKEVAQKEAQARADEALRKAEAASRTAEAARKKADSSQKKAEHPLAEFLYFEENRPRPVDPRNLERFAASCPPWLRAMVDPLSADDAREYLTIIYRQVYPHPAEIPADPGPARGPERPAPGPKPASKRPSTAAPF